MTNTISALVGYRFVALRALWIVYTALVLAILDSLVKTRFEEVPAI